MLYRDSSEITVSNAGFKVRTKKKLRVQDSSHGCITVYWVYQWPLDGRNSVAFQEFTTRAPKGRRDITLFRNKYEQGWRRYTPVGRCGYQMGTSHLFGLELWKLEPVRSIKDILSSQSNILL